jgi:hypothetical protein
MFALYIQYNNKVSNKNRIGFDASNREGESTIALSV